MNLSHLTLFGAIKTRMAWNDQRQEVITHNIANSDTPDYRAQDLRDYNFRDLVRRQSVQVQLARTSASHAMGHARKIRDFHLEVLDHPAETAPNGNSVILEEQIGKMNEITVSHDFSSSLYKKNLMMIKIALKGQA